MKAPLQIIFQSSFSRLVMTSKSTFYLLFVLLFTAITFYFSVNLFNDLVLGYFLGNETFKGLYEVLGIISAVVMFLPFTQVFGMGYIVKNHNANSYANLIIFSNLISIALLVLSYYSLSQSLVTFAWWVILSEMILAFTCSAIALFSIFKLSR